MPFLPSFTGTPKGSLEQFIYDNEPAGKVEARAFRQGLIAVLNDQVGGAKTTHWCEHPDSHYLEE